jgi:subtilisin family serine protease
LFRLELSRSGRDAVLDAINMLRKDSNVEFAEPDYQVKAVRIPNDPQFNQLYGMNNNGQTGGTADADIDAVEVWDVFTGSGEEIIIGVIDTGVDYLHPDLTDNIWQNLGEIPDNGIDDDGNGYVDDYYGWDFAYDDNDPIDDNGHGTHCSGIIAAKGNNKTGVCGVMWNARIMAIKFLDDDGFGYTSDAIDAVDYAIAMNVPITSNSWGGGGYSQALEEVIAQSGIFVAAAVMVIRTLTSILLSCLF